MMSGNLEEKKRNYNTQWRVHWIVARMRWFTFILGPFPLIWDNVLWPILQSMGAPDFVTMEDFIQAILFNFLNIDKWIDQEAFEKMWPHIVNVSTILFVVFVVWTMKVRKSMKKAAKDVIIAEDQMHIGGYHEY
ncbi:MAG: hypothetical protein VX320_02010 [Candidatus Thermoplasmatota archaeon]|nr:hypothetical protein [Candidatus Thermoplasmatota archaeon]